MDIALKIVLIFHFIGLSMIIGGALHQVKEKAKNVTRTMLDGAYLQILTGVALVGLIYADDGEPNNAKISVKFGIALLVAVLAFLNRKKRTDNVPVWGSILLLTIANVAIAIFW